MRSKSKGQGNKVWLVVGAEVALVVGLGAGVWGVNEWALVKREAYVVARHKLENYPTDDRLRSELGKAAQAYAEDKEDLRAMLMPLEGVGKTVEELRSLGEKRGVRVQVPKIQEYREVDDKQRQTNDYTGMKEVEMYINATGRADDLILYLRDLESLPYALAVKDWDVRVGDVGGQNMFMVATVDDPDAEAVTEAVLSGRVMVLFQEEEV